MPRRFRPPRITLPTTHPAPAPPPQRTALSITSKPRRDPARQLPQRRGRRDRSCWRCDWWCWRCSSDVCGVDTTTPSYLLTARAGWQQLRHLDAGFGPRRFVRTTALRLDHDASFGPWRWLWPRRWLSVPHIPRDLESRSTLVDLGLLTPRARSNLQLFHS